MSRAINFSAVIPGLSLLALFSLMVLFPDITFAGEGLSKLVTNVATEGKDSLDPMLVIAGALGVLFVIAAIVMFATHKQGKQLMLPILLLVFGGALLSSTYIMSLSSKTLTQGETVNIDDLVK